MVIAYLLRGGDCLTKSRRSLMKPKAYLRRTVLLITLVFGSSGVLVAQQDSIYRLPVGTRIRLKMDVELSSKFASVNDTFLASVVAPVRVNETVILPAGSIVEGRVVEVLRAAHAGRDGKLQVVFESLKLDYGTRKIDGVFVGKSVKEQTSKSFLTSFLEVIALKKGNEARIRKDEEFEIELRKDVVLPTLAY